MPRRTRKAKVRRVNLDTLTEWQRYELMTGHDFFNAGFLDDEESRRAAWFTHRGELLDACEPGTRPWGWWRYEASEMRRPIGKPMPKRIHYFPGAGAPAVEVLIPQGCDREHWIESTYFGTPQLQGGGVPFEYEHETEYLRRLGLLSADEEKQVMASWPDVDAQIRGDVAGLIDDFDDLTIWAEQYLEDRRNAAIPDDFDSGELTAEQQKAITRALELDLLAPTTKGAK